MATDWKRLCIVSLVIGGIVCCVGGVAAADRPNIIHILADDLGWGSVGFNGQTQIQTPNLDALATAGVTFSHAYAATVCGPSRAMLYTGYHNGHTLVDSNQNLNGDVFRDDGQTVGDYLQAAGYCTALFGKWGFGGTGNSSNGLDPNPTIDGPDSIPTAQGFQTFYGYLDHARAHSYRVDSLWTTEQPFDDNGNGIDEVGEKYASQPATALGMWLEKTGNNNAHPDANYSADLVTQKSLDYIEARAATCEPFYMEYASTIPHFDIDAIRNQPGWFDAYGEAYVPGSDSWTDQQKAYAAMVTRLDDAVGQIVSKLRDPNGDGDQADSIIDNTLIVFTSDNGPTPEDASPISYFDASGGKRGGKRDLWDGGINVPMFVYWEGVIAPGQSDRHTDLPDFMPTALELAGVEGRVGLDGVSYAHELTGQGVVRTKNHIIQEHHEGNGPDPDSRDGRWAIIRSGFKLIRFSNGDLELYDLENDFSEQNPLSFADPHNAALRDELQAVALAEGVEQSDSYTVEFQDWTGAVDGNFNNASNWSGTTSGAPDARWSAVLENTTGAAQVVTSNANTTVLGLDVGGDSASQTLRLSRATRLIGRNEVRVSDRGRVQLDDATLATSRWVDVKEGGELTGHGHIVGDVYNWGTISPGLPSGLSPDVKTPDLREIPQGVDTGIVGAIAFDFSAGDGQDEAPLTQTLFLSEYLEVTEGLDFGPGVSPRNSADAGREFNVQGFQNGSDIDSAIAAEDYLTYTVEPVFGIEMKLDKIRFSFWRNGSNAAQQFGIMTSIDGFQVGDELATSPNYSSSDVSTHSLTAQYAGNQWTQEPVEVRFYGWNANTTEGNIHVNDVAMTASFRTISAETAVAFDFAAQGDGQDEAPLSATSAKSDNLHIVSGLALGPGLAFKGSAEGTNHGNEFDVKNWSTGATLEDAIAGSDYITYTVQAIAGVEMQVREVSFELWRNGVNAPDSFAITSSLNGFQSGDQLGTMGPVINDDGSAADPSDLIGFDSRTTFTVQSAAGIWTTDPVEVRLYGWGANNEPADLHVTGAAMTAFFRSIGGPDVALDPTGILTLDGNFFHIDGAIVNLDLGGVDQSDPLKPQYDEIVVSGMAELAGNLSLSLVDDYSPNWGDAFMLVSADDGITGTFSQVTAVTLLATLQWSLEYRDAQVVLGVVGAGDFNRDGIVDAADYTVWRDALGQKLPAFTGADADGNGLVDLQDYAVWKSNYGFSGASTEFFPATVPEPSAAAMACIAALMSCYVTTHSRQYLA